MMEQTEYGGNKKKHIFENNIYGIMGTTEDIGNKIT
jgi:hypothetical protein